MDEALGSDLAQSFEDRHLHRVIEAIDYAEEGEYAEAIVRFLTAAGTGFLPANKHYCTCFAQIAKEAQERLDIALSNSAAEATARKLAKEVWHESYGKLSDYLNFLGVSLSEHKRLDIAIRCYTIALQFNPNHAMAHFSRGNTKADLHLFEEAIIDLEKAAQLFQSNSDLDNYQNAINSFNIVKNAKAQRDNLASNKQQFNELSDKNYGDSDEMIRNAARFEASILLNKTAAPKAPLLKLKLIAMGELYNYLKQRYDSQEYRFNELDREILKATSFYQGKEVERVASRRKSVRSFLIGLLVGGATVFVILQLT